MDGPPEGTDAPAASAARLLAATAADNLTEQDAGGALREAAVSVLGRGEAAAEMLRQLRRCGMDNVSSIHWDLDPAQLAEVALVIAAPAPSELPKLRAWNETALRHGTSWLQVLPFDGRIAAVGPLYVPGHTCCYECFLRRRAANLPLAEGDFWALEEAPAAYPEAPPLQAMACGLAATLVLRFLGEHTGQPGSHLPGAMHAIEWNAGLEVSRHFVFRVPRCSACFGERGVPSPWHS